MIIHENIEIRLESGVLDLYEDTAQNFFINRISHDLSNLETRETESTNVIDIPYTQNNIKLLELDLPEYTHSSKQNLRIIPVEVLIGGVPVIKEGGLVVNYSSINFDEKSIQVSIYGGEVLFFSKLSDDSIRLLDWTEYNFEWTIDNLADLANRSEGIVYADSIWFDNQSIQRYINEVGGLYFDDWLNVIKVDTSGFFVYFKTVVQKILDTIPEFEFDLSEIPIEYYDYLVLSCPMYKIFDESSSPPGYSAIVRANNFKIINDQSNVRVVFDEEIEDNLGLWDDTNNNFVILEKDLINVILTVSGFIYGTYPYDSPGTENVFKLIHNGVVVEQTSYPDQQAGRSFDFEFNTQLNVNPGDTIWFEVDSGWNYYENTKIDLNALFDLNKSFSESSRFINVSDWLPDISQKDFILDFFKLFHIVPIREIDTIRFKLWDKILEREKIDFTPFMDLSKGYNITNLISGYAKNNRVHYLDNDQIERKDFEIYFPVAADYLEDKTDKLGLNYSATDLTVAKLIDGNDDDTDRVCIPAYGVERKTEPGVSLIYTNGTNTYTTSDKTDLKKGDLIFSDESGTVIVRKITRVLSDVDGEVDINWNADKNDTNWYWQTFTKKSPKTHIAFIQYAQMKLQDGGTWVYPFASRKANFIYDLSMVKLWDLFYKTFADTVYKPIVMEAWFNIPVQDYLNLDFLKPVHLSNLNKDFYINKIEQYKANQSCRLQLVSLTKYEYVSPNSIFTLNPDKDKYWDTWFNNSGDPVPSMEWIFKNNDVVPVLLYVRVTNIGQFILTSGGEENLILPGTEILIRAELSDTSLGDKDTYVIFELKENRDEWKRKRFWGTVDEL